LRPRPAAAGATLQQIAKPAGKTYVVKIDSHVEEAAAEIGLEEAAVIVSGGRGLGSAEPFDSVLKPLAKAFGGAVGATRAVADAGWVPYSMQIGPDRQNRLAAVVPGVRDLGCHSAQGRDVDVGGRSSR
jgi:electron transfer flavoprotein alpha subunit